MENSLYLKIQKQYNDAYWEAFWYERPLCVFNHPLFKGMRFEVNTPAAARINEMKKKYRRNYGN